MGKENPKYSVTGFYVSCGSEDYSKSTIGSTLGLSGPKKVKKYTFAYPDLESMIKSLEDSCNEYDKQGYDVENILPLNIGSTDEYLNHQSKVVTTASYSVTRGAMIVAKRRDDDG
ncbi:MAG: hypothetical protein HLX50_18035 [Alteromonadaceae bacterium]|nr:hypothetical protein [Alteromonadaceae bacterium]